MIKWLFRMIFKITSLIPTWIVFRYKYYHENKAKKSFPIKGGRIVIANHTSLIDFFTIIFGAYFHYARTIVSEAIYSHKFLGWLCNMMGCIVVHRERSDMSFIAKAEQALKKNQVISIFPEGHLVKNKDIDVFKPAVVYLALRTGAPIVPCYIDAHYFNYKRTRVIYGEEINLRDYCSEKNPSIEKVRELCEMLRNKVKALKRQMELYQKMHTYEVFSLHHKFLDVSRIVLKSMNWLVFPTKIHYVGNATKKDRKIVGRGLIISKHSSFYDPPILYMTYMSRRIRIIVAEEMYKKKPWLLSHLSAIEYRRVSNSMDSKCFLETINTLRANGVVGIYPEGHLTLDGLGPFQDGAAYFSLVTNSPVYLYLMANPWKPFHRNHIMIGETIYPDKLFTKEEMKSKQTIHTFTEILYDKMLTLYNESIKYQKLPKNNAKN